MMDTQPVTIKKLENAGKFICSPKSNADSITYLDFLSSLNTYFERKKKDVDPFIPETGDFVAVYTSVGDAQYELWYRAKIMQMFEMHHGIMAKCICVDEGEMVCTPRARMRKLPDKFLNYPHQLMTCVLSNLVPVTIGAAIDLTMSFRKTQNWDSSATKFMEDLIKDADTSVSTVNVDEDNVHHVTLHIEKNNQPAINVNELLIKEKYATLKTTDDVTLREESIVAKSSDNTSNRTSQSKPSKSLDHIVQMEKQKKLKRMKQQCNKDVADLLKLLHGSDEIRSSPRSHPSESSGTEQSDVESSPAPALSNYKRLKPSLNPSEVITNKLGKESSDFLTRGFGLTKEEAPKRVTFSADVSGTERRTNNEIKTKIVPDYSRVNISPDQSPEKEIPISRNVDSSFLSNALCGGSRNVKKVAQSKFSDDDVLVYGKLKRDPFQNATQLNLPLPLKTCLSDKNYLNPTSFQKHMWPAIAAFRNVVGIAEAGTSVESKVLGYVLPILCNMIGQEGTYSTLGKKNAPFLIICVAGWQEARHVFDICEELTGYYRKTMNIDIRYGGMGSLAERNIRLVNGCDLFITTVSSLNHVLEKNYIVLDRLCHVVFDNADMLVETFTEDIKVFMRTYSASLKKTGNFHNNQIIAVSKKWSYGIHSLMKSYLDDPLVIIANKIESALFVKVPIVPEICNSSDRLEHLIGFLETEAADENSIVFTNSAVGAERLHEELKAYSIITNVITDYTTPLDMRDIKLAWNAGCVKSKSNVLILSDNAVVQSNLKNATSIIHYDYPQKKSHFGNRLSCLLNSIRENENKDKPKPLLCQIFITEKNNGVRYCTGLVKLIKRSGQKVPDLLKSMAVSSYELKEEQKEFSEICPRLQLFGECRYLDDCMERHTIFKDKDLLGLCPSTGFVKVLILDTISASSFWGRIVEHRLPYGPEGSAYDTTVYLKLTMDMQIYYSDPSARTLCVNVEKYDVCVMCTIEYGYQRVRIEKILEKEYERPKTLEVFGIDNGFTSVAQFNKLIVCADQFRKIPPQAVEIIACCVRPIERGNSWTDEASKEIESKVKGKTLEGRVQFSLQNTIWVDPLVEKKMMSGIQTKTYAIDIGRDLLNMGYAERNFKHVENLRKLLFDVQGHPIEVTGNKQNLPASMIEHETAYLNDDDYEEVYVSAVVDPGLFFVQRMENSDMIRKLDNKIHATMSIQKTKDELVTSMFPVGYLCVAEFSGDEKWYRAQILGISKDQYTYDIFFVDHGDREWVGKSKVAPGWPDILTEPFQAIECCFKNISPFDSEWTLEDGDVLWDLVESKLLSAKVLSISASTYIHDTLSYEIELFDTTCNQTQNINHELVFMGVAKGSLQCLQQMFPHASICQTDKIIKNEFDKCPDLCVEIHGELDISVAVEKANELKSILLSAPLDSDVLVANGSMESVCRLLALTKKVEVQEVLLSALSSTVSSNEKCALAVEDNDGIKALVDIMKKTESEILLLHIIQIIQFAANDPWSLHVLHHMAFINSLCNILQNSNQSELLITVLDALVYFCKDDESNCTAVRQADGLDAICNLYRNHPDLKVVERCTDVLLVVLQNSRNKEKIREIGGLQIIASLSHRRINEPSFKNILTVLRICMEDNEPNREYLHKINAHGDLLRCKQSPRKMSIIVRMLLNELIQKLTPAPITDFFEISGNEIDPAFCNLENNEINDDIFTESISPKTLWSQRLNTVSLSIQLRGVNSEVTDVLGNRINFRTVLNHVEYVLDLELYADVKEAETIVTLKGGEVLVMLFKVNKGEIWPRLLASTEKPPYLGIDFDRWIDEIPVEIIAPPEDGTILFQPDLPRPPICKSYLGEPVCVDEPRSSADEGSSDEEIDEIVENIGAHEDYFNI